MCVYVSVYIHFFHFYTKSVVLYILFCMLVFCNFILEVTLQQYIEIFFLQLMNTPLHVCTIVYSPVLYRQTCELLICITKCAAISSLERSSFQVFAILSYLEGRFLGHRINAHIILLANVKSPSTVVPFLISISNT